MIIEGWKPFLQELTKELIKDQEICFMMEDEGCLEDALAGKWLGRPPVDDAGVIKLETRLETALPKSYKDFLKTTDGWGPVGFNIRRMLPAAEVNWYREIDPELIEAWCQGESWDEDEGSERPDVPDEDYFVYGKGQDVCSLRSRYLWSCLKISDREDDTTLLLNPEVRNADGEWEAWMLGAKLPGAIRYPSFADLMRAQLETARDYQPEAGPDKPIQSMPRPSGKASDEPN